MIRLGTPADVSKYVCLDGNLAFMAYHAGNIPGGKMMMIACGSSALKRLKRC